MKISRVLIAGIDCLISEPEHTSTKLETIVCLHGIGGDDASFEPQQSLADTYRVVAWNMPGYSQSQKINPVTFDGLADSLQKLLLALDHGPVHLLGQSIGGMIAQEAWLQFPRLIKSLMLVATTTAFGGRDDTFKKAFLAARLKPLDSGLSMQQVASAAMPEIASKNTSPQIIQSAIDSMAHLDTEVYREVLRCLVTFNRRAEWKSIKCPVCLVAGSEDTNAPAATMQKMAATLKQAQYHQIAGAGHLVNLERGEEFNSIARSFLREST